MKKIIGLPSSAISPIILIYIWIYMLKRVFGLFGPIEEQLYYAGLVVFVLLGANFIYFSFSKLSNKIIACILYLIIIVITIEKLIAPVFYFIITGDGT